MTTRTLRAVATTAGVLVTACVAAGCGGDGGGGATSTPRTAATSRSASAPAPSPTRPSAQDGRNYRACLGGTCEIAVSGPVTITLSDSPVDAGPMTVRQVRAGSVVVRMALPAGPSLDATVKQGCTAAFSGNNASGLAQTSCSHEPGDVPGMYVKQLVTVEDITDGTAILDLRSE